MVPLQRASGEDGGLLGIAGPCVNMTRTTHAACVQLEKSKG